MAPAALSPSPHPPAKPPPAESRRPCGLKNLGNTCYLNSVLQCLASTPPLADFCRRSYHSTICNKLFPRKENECVFCVLEAQIARLWRPLDAAVALESPSKVLRCIPQFGDVFRVGRQEDAHEFLRYMVDGCDAACIRVRKRLKAAADARQGSALIMQHIFGGVLVSQVKCLACKGESNKIDGIMDISLDLMGCNSVDMALQQFFQVEVLDGVNKYSCETCKKLTMARKQMFIDRAPRVLVIHLKRFTPLGGKINRSIEFHESLLLSKFMRKESQHSQHQYHLFGVVVHSGFSPESGHYYAYVKDAFGRWYCCNDAHVSLSSLQEVLSEKVYMLFYKLNNEVPKSNGYHSSVKLINSNGTGVADLTLTDRSSLASKKGNGIRPEIEINSAPTLKSAKIAPSLQINLKKGGKASSLCNGNGSQLLRSKAQSNDIEGSSDRNSKDAVEKAVSSNGNQAVTSNGNTLEIGVNEKTECSANLLRTQNTFAVSAEAESQVHLHKGNESCGFEATSGNVESAELPAESAIPHIDDEKFKGEEKFKERLAQDLSSMLRSCGWVDKLDNFLHSRKRSYEQEQDVCPDNILVRKRLRIDYDKEFKSQIPQTVKEHLVERVRAYFEGRSP